MMDLDQLTCYAKEKVNTTELPPGLYTRIHQRKALVDSILTVLLTSTLLHFAIHSEPSNISIQSPETGYLIRQELLAARENHNEK